MLNSTNYLLRMAKLCSTFIKIVLVVTIFFEKKKSKNEKEQKCCLSRCGEDTRHVPALPKDYDTTVAELEPNDLMKVRSRRRLTQSEGLCCVYGLGVLTVSVLLCSVSCVRPTGWIDW